MTDDSRSARARYHLVASACRLSGHLPPHWDRRARDLGKAVVNYRGARRTLPRQLLFPLLRRTSSVLQVPFGRAQLLIPTDDEEIGRVVFATGGYERLYMALAVEELTRRGYPVEGTTFVDVGANIGTSTIDALVQFGFGRAVCFEPDQRSFRLLLANAALNGLEDRVRALPVALSATNGRSALETSPTNRGDNRLVVPGRFRPATDRLVEVECRRFDDLVAEGLIGLKDVGLLWLDAQGHEPFVLQGAVSALAAGVPMVLEYTPAVLRDTGALERLDALLREHYTTVVDLHRLGAGLREEAVLPATGIAALHKMTEGEHTDLLLVRSG